MRMPPSSITTPASSFASRIIAVVARSFPSICPCRNAIISIFVPRIKSTQQQYFPVFNQEKMNRGYKFEILFFHNAWIKKFSSPKIKIWFEPMFFFGFFCGFERCGSAAFPNFRGGTSSPPAAAKCVRTNSRILHHKKPRGFWVRYP